MAVDVKCISSAMTSIVKLTSRSVVHNSSLEHLESTTFNRDPTRSYRLTTKTASTFH